MSGPIPFDAINRAALAVLPRLLAEWFPNGKLHGQEFTIGSLAGEPGESLSINVNTGEWADFARSEDKGGDVVSLYAAKFCNKDQGRAARELGPKLGIKINGTAYQAAPKFSIRAEETWEPMIPPPPDAPKPSDAQLGYCDTLYEYRGPNHGLLFYVRRTEARDDRRKQFHPLVYGTRNGTTGWHSKHPGNPKPLYRLERLAAMPDATVILAEGEKAADSAQEKFPAYACLSWCGVVGSSRRRTPTWPRSPGGG